MRAILTTAATVAALAMASIGCAGAAAAPPPAPSCVGLAGTQEAADVWWGQFSGGRMQPSGSAVVPMGIAAEGCFPTRRACEHWLYRMKGAYSALLPASSTDCRHGYRGIY
jgi:hypothetical protein